MFSRENSRLSSPIAASAISASTSNIHGFPCFPLAFPDGNGLAAQLHKQSPVGTTRQLLCSRAAIPCRRQILRKSARNESSSFFLEKKNKVASKPSAKRQLGPQPKLQANAVLSKIARCHVREIEHARERRKISIRLRGYACCAQLKISTFPEETKIQPPQHLPPTATANAKSRAAGSKLPVECSAELKRLLRCRCKPELL